MTSARQTEEILIELRAIRSLLENQAEDQARCPHGAVGICMNCIIPQVTYELSQITRQITNVIFEALRGKG